MKNKDFFKDTQLVCMNCGNVVTLQRKLGRFKRVGHIKHLYCYKCDSVKEHYEVRDVSIFIWECSGKGILNLDSNTKLVFDFLMKREDDNERETCRVYKKMLTKE